MISQSKIHEAGSFTEDVAEYLATDPSIVETARQIVALRGAGPNVSTALLAAVLEAFSSLKGGHTHPLVQKLFCRALCFEVDWQDVLARLTESNSHERT